MRSIREARPSDGRVSECPAGEATRVPPDRMDEIKRRAARDERTGWAKNEGLTLTARDVTVLYAVGRCRALPTRDLVALSFGSRATASDRLRKLHVHGYLAVHVTGLNSDNIYVLTEKGRRVLLEHPDVDAADISVPRALPARVEHLMCLNRVRVLMTVAAREPRAPFALSTFRPEWDLLAERHAALIELVPDGIAQLVDAAGQTTVVAIEADVGTEAPTVIAKKIIRYDNYARSGQPLYGYDITSVIIVAPGERRVRSLARAVIAANPTHVSARLAELGSLTAENFFTAFHRPATWLAGVP